MNFLTTNFTDYLAEGAFLFLSRTSCLGSFNGTWGLKTNLIKIT